MTIDDELIDQFGTFLDVIQDENTSERLYDLSNKIQKRIEIKPFPSVTHESYKAALKSLQSYVIALADEIASEEAVNRAQYERERYWEIRDGG